MESKAQILYVDDEPNNLFAFKSVFRRTYSVLTASGGAEALSLIKDNKIDLVLSDHRMPEMTGVELCKYIMNQFPTLKRMIVTGYQDEESIQDALAEGIISKLIAKPWDKEILNQEIQSVLKD